MKSNINPTSYEPNEMLDLRKQLVRLSHLPQKSARKIKKNHQLKEPASEASLDLPGQLNRYSHGAEETHQKSQEDDKEEVQALLKEESEKVETPPITVNETDTAIEESVGKSVSSTEILAEDNLTATRVVRRVLLAITGLLSR